MTCEHFPPDMNLQGNTAFTYVLTSQLKINGNR